jgi:hypothetical protein
MSNMAHVVQQLRKERDQAQRGVEQLDEALKALSGVGALHTTTSRHAVLRCRAGSEGPCQLRLAGELQRPSACVGRSGKRHRRN